MLECQSPKAAFQFEHSSVCVCAWGSKCLMYAVRSVADFVTCPHARSFFELQDSCGGTQQVDLKAQVLGGVPTRSARHQLCGHGPHLLKAYFLLHCLWTNTETPVCCSCTDVGRTCGSDWYIVTVDFPLCFLQKINNVRKRHYLIRSCSRFEHIKKSCLCVLCVSRQGIKLDCCHKKNHCVWALKLQLLWE